jgi:hypothetical protein
MKLILTTVILIVIIFIPKVSLGARMVILSFDDSLQFAIYWNRWSYELDSDKYPTKRKP